MRRPGFAVWLVLAATGCSNRLLLYPTHDPLESYTERLSFTATRAPIAGRSVEVFRATLGEAPPAVTVLAFGGNGGRAELEINRLHGFFAAEPRVIRCGVEILAVQYPGFGTDDEPATLRGLAAASLDAWDWARDRAEPGERPIVVYGLSMGTTAALHIARTTAETAEPGPAGLILDRAPNIPSLVLGKYGWWNLWLISGPVAMSLPRSVHSRANARRVDEWTAALFIVASEDHLASPRNVGKIVRAYAGPKMVAWFDGGHNAAIDADIEPIGAGVRWLWERAGCPE